MRNQVKTATQSALRSGEGSLGRSGKIASIITFSSGIILLMVAFAIHPILEGGLRRFLFAYLTAFSYILSLSLGALFFVSIQHITRASWSVVVRRIAEFLAGLFPWLSILFIPILIGIPIIYEWTNTELLAHDQILQGKQAYLNIPFFVARGVVYFTVWIFSSLWFLRGSLKQDKTGEPGVTIAFQRASAPILILFGLTLTFFTFDFIMSLDPHWYSTILGVYYFAGSSVGIFALLVIILAFLQAKGYTKDAIRTDHFHNLGKFLFGFIVFWAYIGFSQFMLIWYANIPEEASWYVKRTSGEWVGVSMVILVGHFVIPFLGLISRFAKRRLPILAFWAFWMLLMRYVDIYWLIMPELGEVFATPGVMELITLVGLFALYVSGFLMLASRYPLVPLKDPRLADSLSFADLK